MLRFFAQEADLRAMMFKFDPDRRRELLESGVGYRYSLSQSFDEAQRLGALGNSADGMLTTGLYCLLVGIDAEGQSVLQRAVDWLEASVKNDEYANDPGRRAIIFSRLSMAHWLLTGNNDKPSLEQAILLDEQYVQLLLSAGDKIHTMTLDAYMSACFQGNLCDRGIDTLKRAGENPDAVKPSKATSLRDVAVVLCRGQDTSGKFSEEAAAAGERLLRRHIGDWLGRGLAIDAATWLKIVHWTPNSGLSPKSVVLKAYDYLGPSLRERARPR